MDGFVVPMAINPEAADNLDEDTSDNNATVEAKSVADTKVEPKANNNATTEEGDKTEPADTEASPPVPEVKEQSTAAILESISIQPKEEPEVHEDLPVSETSTVANVKNEQNREVEQEHLEQEPEEVIEEEEAPEKETVENVAVEEPELRAVEDEKSDEVSAEKEDSNARNEKRIDIRKHNYKRPLISKFSGMRPFPRPSKIRLVTHLIHKIVFLRIFPLIMLKSQLRHFMFPFV